MKKIQFLIPDPVVKGLDEIAKKKDVTRSEVVRTALEKFLKEEKSMKNNLSLDEFASRMLGGESRYAPGKGITYVGPLHVVLPGDVMYDFYAEWDCPGIEDHCDEDGELTSEGYELMRKNDELKVKEAYEAYKEGYAYYVNVEGVGSAYDYIKGEDIAE